MKKFAVILSAAFVLGGCSWSHPYKGESEFYADKYDCEQQVQAAIPNQKGVDPATYAAMTPQQRGASGAYQGGASLGTGINQMLMFNSCMKSKGYQ